MYNFTEEQKRIFKIMEVNNFNKKCNLVLIGKDGNAFYLLGSFSSQAKKEKWTKDEIDFVLWKSTSGDYNKLLKTLMEHSSDPFGEESGEIVYIDGVAYKKI